MSDDDLQRIASMLAADNKEKELLINKLITLVERSESRIDQTNKMVNEMAAMVTRASVLTADHIKQLRTCLSTATDNQNKLLAELNTTHRLVEYLAGKGAPNVQINGSNK